MQSSHYGCTQKKIQKENYNFTSNSLVNNTSNTISSLRFFSILSIPFSYGFDMHMPALC